LTIVRLPNPDPSTKFRDAAPAPPLEILHRILISRSALRQAMGLSPGEYSGRWFKNGLAQGSAALGFEQYPELKRAYTGGQGTRTPEAQSLASENHGCSAPRRIPRA
jgi:hypothetical protein